MNLRRYNKNKTSNQRADCFISESGVATIPEQAIRPFKKIPLTQGKFSLVDAADFEELSKFKWFAHKNRYGGYVAVRACRCPFTKRRSQILMHRQLMSCPRGMDIDHINHDTLLNCRYNLRICSHLQNMQNQRLQGGTSQFKGVSWKKHAKKWQAEITLNCKRHYIGLFDNEIGAAKAYDTKAKELFGEFALLNFPKITDVKSGNGLPIFEKETQ